MAKTIINKSPVYLEMRMWRAFELGIGKHFEFSDFKPPDKITLLTINPKAQYVNHKWKSEAPVKGMSIKSHLLLITWLLVHLEEISDEDESNEEPIDSDDDNRMNTSQYHDGLVNRTDFDCGSVLMSAASYSFVAVQIVTTIWTQESTSSNQTRCVW